MKKITFLGLIFCGIVLLLTNCNPASYETSETETTETETNETGTASFNISISWNELREHSFIVYKKNNKTTVDTFTRKYSSNLINYHLDFEIDNFIVVPFKGQASSFTTNDSGTISLANSRIDTICYVHYIGQDTSGLNLATRRINAALEALYCGVQLVFETHEVDASLSSIDSFPHIDMLESFWDEGLVPSDYTYYFVEKLKNEPINRANYHATNNLPGYNNKHIVFADSGVIDLTFLSIHELMHALTLETHEENKFYDLNVRANNETVSFKDIMSKEDIFCRYAISQDYFKAIHKIENSDIDSFIIAARDTLRECNSMNSTTGIDLREWLSACTNCRNAYASAIGNDFNIATHKRYQSTLNTQYNLYFKGIGKREDFVNLTESLELKHLINLEVDRLGLDHSGSLKSKMSSYKDFISDTSSGKLVRYQIPNKTKLQLGQYIYNTNLNKNIKVLNDGSFYLNQQDLINGKIKFSGEALNLANLKQINS
jgi:hypothetical protein